MCLPNSGTFCVIVVAFGYRSDYCVLLKSTSSNSGKVNDRWCMPCLRTPLSGRRRRLIFGSHSKAIRGPHYQSKTDLPAVWATMSPSGASLVRFLLSPCQINIALKSWRRRPVLHNREKNPLESDGRLWKTNSNTWASFSLKSANFTVGVTRGSYRSVSQYDKFCRLVLVAHKR